MARFTIDQILGERGEKYGLSALDLVVNEYPATIELDDVGLCEGFSKLASTSPDIQPFNLEQKIPGTSVTFKVPIMNSAMRGVGEPAALKVIMDQGGIGCLHRLWVTKEEAKQWTPSKIKAVNLERQGEAYKQCREMGFDPFVAVGLDRKQVRTLFDAGARLFCIDVLKGWALNVDELIEHLNREIRFIRDVKSDYGVAIVAGNFNHPEAALHLAEQGVEIIKEGMGPGAMCTTSVGTGHRAGHMTSAVLSMENLKRHQDRLMEMNDFMPLLVIDGGMVYPGDVAKAIGCGAHAVMIGTEFAGTDEGGGMVIEDETGKWVEFGGQAAPSASQVLRAGKSSSLAQGVDTRVPHRGSIGRIFRNFYEGLCAGMANSGCASLTEFHKRARFLFCTTATVHKGRPRALLEAQNVNGTGWLKSK